MYIEKSSCDSDDDEVSNEEIKESIKVKIIFTINISINGTIVSNIDDKAIDWTIKSNINEAMTYIVNEPITYIEFHNKRELYDIARSILRENIQFFKSKHPKILKMHAKIIFNN